jgi:tetratricopeptide (TPR) repeat protein
VEKIFLTAGFLSILFLSSCSNPDVYYSVWSGNNSYAGGNYQKANTLYLRALEEDFYAEYISYNLANVYYALGEAEAAYAEWEKAVFTQSKELLFRTLYNRGILEFETGNYQKAFESFKKALELNPDSYNAKINLEYSLRRMNAGSDASASAAAGAETSETTEISEEIQRILEFIKKKDTIIWSAGEEGNVGLGEKDW